MRFGGETLTLAMPLLIAIAGLILYGLTNGKPSEAGRILFFAGMLAFLLK